MNPKTPWMGWNRFQQTDIQSFFSKKDSFETTVQSDNNNNSLQPTNPKLLFRHYQSHTLVDCLHRHNQLQLSTSQIRKRTQKLRNHRLLNFIAAEDQSQRHVASIEFDGQETIFALAYSERSIEIHELLPFLLKKQYSNNGSNATVVTPSKDDKYTADTLRLRLDTQQRKHSVSKFSPVNNITLACGFRNCHTAWLFDLERCSETEPTQVLGRRENLAVGCQNLCFGSQTNTSNNYASCLACACNDGLGRIYDIRSREVSSASVVLRRHVAQRRQASAILLDDHFVYMGYHSGEIAQFDLRMTESSYASPLRCWDHENFFYENKETFRNTSNKLRSAIDDIVKDPFFPSTIIVKNRDGAVMGIDTQRNRMVFLQDNPTSNNTEKNICQAERTKRPRIYGIEETVFSQETFFTQSRVELQDENRLLSLASRVKRVHRLQCYLYCERTTANLIFPDPFSSNLRCIDIIESMKTNSRYSARQIALESNSIPCAVAVHKPTDHLLVGLLNGKTIVLEM